MQTDEYARLFEHEDRYWWFVGRRRLALALLGDALAGRPDAQLLDLGCGTGAALTELAQQGCAFGVDFSLLALDFSYRRGLTRLCCGDAQCLPFRSEVFDGIIALDVVEHVENDAEALAEAFRVLKPGGVLVMSVPAFKWLWGPHDVALMHYRRYTRPQVRAALSSAGFEVEKLSYGVFSLFPAVVGVRFADRLRRGPAKVSLPHVPDWANAALVKLQDVETGWTRRFSLPWGSSVVAVARKPCG